MRTPRPVLAFAALLPLATLALYFVGFRAAPPGKTFLWIHALNTGDPYAYLAWIEQARQGAWSFRILFTGEPCRALLVHPLFLAVGWIARALGISSLAAFHGARVVLGGALLLVLWRFFARRLGPNRGAFALLYAALGSGLGWLFVRPHAVAANLPVDLWMPEAILFLSLLESPLFLAGLLLAILLVERIFPADEGPPRGGILGIFLLAVLLGLTHPFELVVVSAATAAAPIVALVLGRRLGAGFVPRAAALAAGAALPALYVSLVLARDPVFGNWLRTVNSPSPAPWTYLAAFAPQMALAAFALPAAVRRGRAALLPIAWIASTAALLYAPIAQPRRFVAGAQIPLTLLATWGLFAALKGRGGAAGEGAGEDAAPAGPARALLALVLLASIPTNAVVVGADLGYFRRGEYPLYLENEIVEAIRDYGARAGSRGLLLASPEVGHFVPGLTGRRTYVGHADMTVDPERKAEDVRLVFDPARPAPERRAVLLRGGVTHLLASPYEAAFAGRDPGPLAGPAPEAFLGADPAALGLRQAFRAGPVVLYEVVAAPR